MNWLEILFLGFLGSEPQETEEVYIEIEINEEEDKHE
jgi:hypothetical protein